MRRAMLAGALLLALGCQGEAEQRLALAAQEVSVLQMKDFTLHQERGSTILSTKTAKKSTIVVRRVDLGERHDRSQESVIKATQASLEALISSHVSVPKAVSHPAFDGVQFDVSFAPPGKGGDLYQRRHVVLFGGKYAYHLLHTAPKGKIGDIADEFASLVKSLREEA